ncbi:hypothetical protein Baya_16422 [Bagarius yarrelli]|uniref:Uncharacterized protein n=1 Tax=Bagarius yarrelli TaxID=175774 RepID=A0A556VVI8_BAGYA|nr:hypothetical protein Baya_16422 [Bagarius yarrelli]
MSASVDRNAKRTEGRQAHESYTILMEADRIVREQRTLRRELCISRMFIFVLLITCIAFCAVRYIQQAAGEQNADILTQKNTTEMSARLQADNRDPDKTQGTIYHTNPEMSDGNNGLSHNTGTLLHTETLTSHPSCISSEGKFNTANLRKFNTINLSKSSTGDQNKSSTGDQNKSSTGDQNKSSTGDQNKSSTGDQNKSSTGDQNKSITADQNKVQYRRPETNLLQPTRTSLNTADQNKSNTADQNKSNTADQNKFNKANQNKSNTSPI